MIRKKNKQSGPIVIDLTGPQGNAYCLLGYANDFGKQLGWDPKKRGDINSEMISGDYENLIKVFDREFGKFVILER
jgi:hypothetical protein